MTTPFDAQRGLVIVRVSVWGPSGEMTLRLALDTGASRTTISHAPLINLGYNPGGISDMVQVTMGGSVEFSPLIEVERIEALGQSRDKLPVLAHTLPPSASVDGLLGLDFFRNHRLILDFVDGKVELI